MEEMLSKIALSDVVFIVIAVAILIFIVKKMIGLAISVFAIFLLFQVGFMFTGNDANNLIGEYVKPETASTIQAFFNDFAARRDENSVVDAGKVFEGMKDVVNTGVEMAKDVLTPENIKNFSSGLAESLKAAGYDDITMDELVNVIADQLETVPEDETVQEIANEILAEMQ